MMRRHTPFWNPDPYQPLDEPRWEDQIAPSVRSRVKELLALYGAGKLEWSDFISDRKSSDGGWGMKMCLWQQHHKNDHHKCLGRPFWSVAAFREWAANVAALTPSVAVDSLGRYSLRTVKREEPSGVLRTFLRHEHVVPKGALINWLVREPGNADAILEKNVCCVITLDEDRQLERDRHPDPGNPWRRYERTGISVLFNPDWPDDVVAELKRHELLTEESYLPFGESTPKYRASK
jgi:hypothetical protein